MTKITTRGHAWRRGLPALVVLCAIGLLSVPADAGHRRGAYPPGELGRLEQLVDHRGPRIRYTSNVFRKSRHYDPFRNPFRSSRHYQRKLEGSYDSYVLRVYDHGDRHHDGHHGHGRYGSRRYGLRPGAYGSRSYLVTPYGAPYAHELVDPVVRGDAPIPQATARDEAPPERRRPGLDPRDIEYRVVNLLPPREPTQEPVMDTITLPDGRTKTVIRSVPVAGAEEDED